MKADLYSAPTRAAGTGGLAHRTDAGFLVMGSNDATNIITLIAQRQNDPDLIDQVVAKAQAETPEAFAMLFTAGGDLYVIAYGTAVAAVTSASTRLMLTAAPGQVLVQAVQAGLHEQAATIRLHRGQETANVATAAELGDGVVDVEWAEIAVGQNAFARESPDVAAPSTTASGLVDSEIVTAADEPSIAPSAAPSAALVEDEPDPDPGTPDPGTPGLAESGLGTPDPGTPGLAESGLEPVVDINSSPAFATNDPPAEVPDDQADSVEIHATADIAEAAAAVGPVMVLGVICPLGHHNHPDAIYCSQCGTKMGSSQTTVLLNGPRPPLGVLVVDDGTTYSLNEDLIIGREPTSHTDVGTGAASPMILSDDSLALSRQHARISLDEWSVSLVDLTSSNGTFVSRAGQQDDWSRVTPEDPRQLRSGDRVRVGGRVIQVELHHAD